MPWRRRTVGTAFVTRSRSPTSPRRSCGWHHTRPRSGAGGRKPAHELKLGHMKIFLWLLTHRPALAPPAATAPGPDSAAPVSDLHHPALIALVRLLARQAVREWLAQPETTELPDPSPEAPSGSRHS